MRSLWSARPRSAQHRTTRQRTQLLLIPTDDHAHKRPPRATGAAVPTPAVRAVRESGPTPASLRPLWAPHFAHIGLASTASVSAAGGFVNRHSVPIRSDDIPRD